MRDDEPFLTTPARPHIGHRFSVGEWIVFSEYLATADVVMQMLAGRYRTRMRRDVEGWPGKSLLRRSGWRVFEVRLQLNPDYLSSWDLHFALSEYWHRPWTGASARRVEVGRYSTAEVRDVARISAAIEHSLRSRRETA